LLFKRDKISRATKGDKRATQIFTRQIRRRRARHISLAGNDNRYGASGDIGIGVGAGANILIGGSRRTVALQPLSLEGSVALNIALGVSMLKLRAV
jgi:Protein of unknown function (DUF992)